MHTTFNDAWKWALGEKPGAQSPDYDDAGWQDIDLPHDWRIHLDFDPGTPNGAAQAFLPGQEVGWYRKTFTLTPDDPCGAAWLVFDGVYHDSEVWLNGHSLGRWAYGYTAFTMDLTPYLNPDGQQLLAVRVDNASTPGCRWYSGAGIHRGVGLVTTGAVHVPEWGISVTTPVVSAESAVVAVTMEINNRGCRAVDAGVSIVVTGPDGGVVSRTRTETRVDGSGTGTVDNTIPIPNPSMWTPESPCLHRLSVTVSVDNRITDDRTITFGIRSIALDPDRGFLLNGVPTKLKGVNIHHDLGCLGAEFHTDAMVRRLKALKSMGCNAIRTSHNPPAREVLDLCDSMGFMVIEESFDKWNSGAYEPFFDEWWQRDIQSMIMRDRNHPCVIMWSVGNEVANQGEPGMIRILGMLADYTRSLDPTRPVTFAMEPHCNPGDLIERVGRSGLIERTLEMADKVDVVSCNYHEQWYAAYREANPGILLLGSECLPYYSGVGNDFRAYRPYNPWFWVRDNDYVIGGFVWAGVDYLGEGRPWPSKGWPTCPIDTCGHRKPQSWFFQAVWTGEPMVRIAVFDDTMPSDMGNPIWSWPKQASHWTLPHFAGGVVRLCTYTNCDEVELLVNNRSYGRQPLSDFHNRIMTWHVPYEAGMVKAIGYRNGREACAHWLDTAGTPVALRLESDRDRLAAGSGSLAFIDAVIVDDRGVRVPTGDSLITFTVTGPGEVIAVDNGDLVSNERFRSESRSAFMGGCMAVVRLTGDTRGARELVVTATSKGLADGTVILGIE